MEPQDLRIALFSGNYNYVRDGANQTLNRLVGFLLRKGASVRVYAPTVPTPAFEATGDLVSVPSVPLPRRSEYRLAAFIPDKVYADLDAFAPNVIHVSSPDVVAHRAISWARRRGIPVVASVHTRFETYLQYYRLELFEPAIRAILRRFYRRCDALMVPSESFAAVLRAQRMNRDISLWERGIDRNQFNPSRRDLGWRRSNGFEDSDFVILYLGRLVLEKGLDSFAEAIAELERRGVPHRVLVVGEGPERQAFETRMPAARFTGQLVGDELARAVASADLFLNPSVTEAFGNVTLEAMACALPVVAASATGASNLVRNDVTGILVDPGEIDQYADALERYAHESQLRAKHGAAGLEFAKTMDWDEINAAAVRTYQRVIERRARGAAGRPGG